MHGKSERNNKERETQKTTARKENRTGNESDSATKLDATTQEHATKPPIKSTTRETKKWHISHSD
jgi:hypothetical protein